MITIWGDMTKTYRDNKNLKEHDKDLGRYDKDLLR